jgi:hypothetical protein
MLLIIASASMSIGAPPCSGSTINVNQHRTPESNTCGTPPTPPFIHLLDSGTVRASSFHLHQPSTCYDPLPGEEGTACDLTRNTWVTAKCYDNHSKPRIFSDDGAFPPPGDDAHPSIMCGPPGHETIQACYIKQLCDTASTRPRGKFHYEHWDEFGEKQLQSGESISSYADWDIESKTFIEWIRSRVLDVNPCFDFLAQNGTIYRNDGANEEALRWKTASSDGAVNLIGFGAMGAIAAGPRLNIENYLHALRVNRVNLTRVWQVDQWVALTDQVAPPYIAQEGLTPFVGHWDYYNGFESYSLSRINPKFLIQLRNFVQTASDHGVVVQLSLFDKHGLRNSNTQVTGNPNCRGQWAGSPYNSLNNDSGYIFDEQMDSCACADPSCYAHPTNLFVDPVASPVFADNYRLIEATLREVGGIGNVIFEIINEQRFDQDWRGDADHNGIYDGEQWQLEVARQVNARLAQAVTRDAFNGVAGPAGLNGRTSNTGEIWSANSHARIVNTAEGGDSGLFMGRVQSDDVDSGEIDGELPIDTNAADLVEVAANLTYGDAHLDLGFRGASSADGLYLEIRRIPDDKREWALILRQNNQESVLTSKIVQAPSPLTFDGHVRLSYRPAFGTVTVYVDSSFDEVLSYPAITFDRTTLDFETDPPVPSGLEVSIEKAFFRGWSWGNYTSGQGAVDNFIANVHYITAE